MADGPLIITPFFGYIGSLPFCVGNLVTKIHGNGIALFRFLTPFPHRPPSVTKRRAVGGENRLKAERARFLTDKVRRAKPETEPLLTRWGKSCVFSESTVLSFLKHTRRPISSASLGGQDRCGETMLGESKGVCPLGRRTQVREGEAASREAASERWKGEGGALSPPRRFGKAKSSRSLLPFPCILPTLSGRGSIYLTRKDCIIPSYTNFDCLFRKKTVLS